MKLFNIHNKKREGILFIFNGESNSAGSALNTELSGFELGVRSAINILNNTSNLFESLDIPDNNMIDQNIVPGTTHGWENGLAYKKEDATISGNVYLVKTGQAGSKISDWNVGGTYYTKMKARVDYAVDNLNPSKIVFFYSQGINDIAAGTPSATWRTDTEAHFASLRSLYGATVPIIMTEFMSGFSSYDATIQALAAADAYTSSVVTTSYPLTDAAHWNAVGMKDMAAAMVAKLITDYGI